MELPINSIGYYQIRYTNGTIQNKHLIPHSFFQEYQSKLKMLDLTFSGKEREEKVEQCKKEFKKESGELFFTTESPLGIAWRTGVLITPHIKINVEFKLLN